VQYYFVNCLLDSSGRENFMIFDCFPFMLSSQSWVLKIQIFIFYTLKIDRPSWIVLACLDRENTSKVTMLRFLRGETLITLNCFLQGICIIQDLALHVFMLSKENVKRIYISLENSKRCLERQDNTKEPFNLSYCCNLQALCWMSRNYNKDHS
jgi:hypothetical protein